LSEQLQKRITPELKYLQVKWAAHLPYATSTRLLQEVLSLNDCISTTGAKSRIRGALDFGGAPGRPARSRR
jgi:hypothetical protein